MSTNFTKGIGRLATDRYDFQDHIDGTKYVHEASAIKVDPTITIGSNIVGDVRSAIEELTVIVSTAAAKATETSPGIVQLDGDIYNLWNNVKVKGLRGYPISNTPPISGDTLVYDGSSYVPSPAISFTAGGDLIGTSTNQKVISITGANDVKYGTNGNDFKLSRDVVATASYTGKDTIIEAEGVSGSNSTGGRLILKGGSSSNYVGGDISIIGGLTESSYSAGNVNIITPDTSESSGHINISTGDSGGDTSGNIGIATGSNSVGFSGSLFFSTANAKSRTGGIQISTGNSLTTSAGEISITAGNATTLTGPSVLVAAGKSDTNNGGSLYLRSGNSDTLRAGDIVLSTGTSGHSTQRGNINFSLNGNLFSSIRNGTLDKGLFFYNESDIAIGFSSAIDISAARDGYGIKIQSEQVNPSYFPGEITLCTGAYDAIKITPTNVSGEPIIRMFEGDLNISKSPNNILFNLAETTNVSNGLIMTIRGGDNLSTSSTAIGGHVWIRSGIGAGNSDTNYGSILLGGVNNKDHTIGSMTIFIANCTRTPTASAIDGGILYVESGALKYRGSSGTTTTIAPA